MEELDNAAKDRLDAQLAAGDIDEADLLSDDGSTEDDSTDSEDGTDEEDSSGSSDETSSRSQRKSDGSTRKRKASDIDDGSQPGRIRKNRRVGSNGDRQDVDGESQQEVDHSDADE